MIQKLAHIGPVLAVKFYKEWCFCAQGPFIEVYEFKTGSKVGRYQIFHRNKVHGISICRNSKRVLLYGSRSVSIITIDELLSGKNLLGYEKMTAEWIVSGEFSYNGDQVYLLTIYNKIIAVDPVTCDIVRTYLLEGERSILYSGSIKVLPTKVLVNAGTIMNGIVIWDLMTQKKLWNLKGHEGAIFYVVANNSGSLLASCSDDRSIKIWDLHTGELLSTGWGHTARIWNLEFFNEDKQLISVSEDCTCRVWDLLNNEIRQKEMYETHLTKNAWCVDVENNSLIAVTGGNDGRIKLTEIRKPSFTNDITVTLEDISKSCKEFEPKKNEIIKGFHLFSFGVVLITSEGNIIQHLTAQNKWVLIEHDERFFSFSITQGINNTVFFMNNKCILKSLTFSTEGCLLNTTEIKLSDLTQTINCISVRPYDENFSLVIESANPNDPLLLLKFKERTNELLEKVVLNKPANLLTSYAEIYGDYLLVGGRFSMVFAFNLLDTTCHSLFVKLPASDAVTSIKHIEDKGGNALFSMTKRDGAYFFASFNFKMKTVKIIHTNKVNRGFLEGSFYDENDEFIVYGFKSNLFHIYNETQQYEIFSQPCGGAHRQWKLFQPKNDNSVLCFVKNSTLNIVTIPSYQFPKTLKNGSHGREIRDISFQPGNYDSNKNSLFITGSEDTTVKLASLNVETGDIINHWSLKTHVSGLQKCKFISDNIFITCSAREELFVWELEMNFSLPYVSLRQKLIPSTNIPDLRIMDFDVIFLEGTENDFIMVSVYSDSSIKLWHYIYDQNKFTKLAEGKYETCCLLGVAFVPFKRSLKLLISTTGGFLVTMDITKNIPFTLNDGKLPNKSYTKDICKELPHWSDRVRVHEAGIKSFELKLNPTAESFMVYTGGDDNAMAITEFSNKDDDTLDIKILCKDCYAASSTITSVNLLDNGNKLLSTSVDQIIRIRDISNNELRILDSQYTTVADTGSCDIRKLEDGRHMALIGGLGLSCWQAT